MAGTADRRSPIIKKDGCSDFILSFGDPFSPTDFMIRDIPQGEKDEATPFARSQKSSRSRSGVDDDVPAAAAQAIQKTQVESISENIRKLTFELRVGLFEKAATPMPATKSDKAYIIGGLKI